jgi:hypothetical protein
MAKPRPTKPQEGKAVQKTSMVFDMELYRSLRIAAIEEGVPVNRLLERLMREYLATRHKGEMRFAFGSEPRRRRRQ